MMKSYLRAAQTFFPYLQNVRFKLENLARRAGKRVNDKDWLAFRQLRIPVGSVIDVGANRGQSIESILVVLPGRKILSFEPNGALASRLAREYRCHTNIHIEAVALSDEIGSAKLYVPCYRKWVFDGLASMNRSEAMSWLNAERLKGFDPRKLTCLEFEVPVRILDSYDLKPAVIKLDTQGTEEQVLRGAAKTLAANKPIILLESATLSIANLLQDYGYHPYAYLEQKFIGGLMDTNNVFFLTSAHLDQTLA